MATTIYDSQYSPSALEPLFRLFAFISYPLVQIMSVFHKIPGSQDIRVACYVKSSRQNNPGHTILENLLALFAIVPSISLVPTQTTAKLFIPFSKKVCQLSTLSYSLSEGKDKLCGPEIG